MDAGGPLPATVRTLSGGDRDESGNSISVEAQPQGRAQKLQLGQPSLSLRTWPLELHQSKHPHCLRTPCSAQPANKSDLLWHDVGRRMFDRLACLGMLFRSLVCG